MTCNRDDKNEKKNIYSSDSDNDSSGQVQLMLSAMKRMDKRRQWDNEIKEIEKTGSWKKTEYKRNRQTNLCPVTVPRSCTYKCRQIKTDNAK